MKSARIYAMETTNYCNAKCTYCPHDKMHRTLGFVSMPTVQKVFNYCKEIGQEYLALHHMGEPLLHPHIEDIIKLFESGGIKTEFSTNGILLIKHGRKVLEAGLTRLRIAVDYSYDSLHYINNLRGFLKLSREFDTETRIHTITGNDLEVFKGINQKVILENKQFDNWAGAVKGESTLEPSKDCYFKKYNYVVMLWDGRIVPCCMDYDGSHPIGTIDGIRSIGQNNWVDLCKNCANMQFAESGEWQHE